MKSEPTKKSFYFNKSGNSSVRLFNEVFTNSTIVNDMLNYVVNFLNIRSLASCWSGKWSIRAMNALYKLFDVVKSNSFMYELNDFYIRNFSSFIVDAGRLQSWSTILYSFSFYSAIIYIRQWSDLRANWIIFVRLPILAYISDIFMHTFLTFYLSDSMFYKIVRAWSRKLIVFYGGRGRSASCKSILPDVACI